MGKNFNNEVYMTFFIQEVLWSRSEVKQFSEYVYFIMYIFPGKYTHKCKTYSFRYSGNRNNVKKYSV